MKALAQNRGSEWEQALAAQAAAISVSGAKLGGAVAGSNDAPGEEQFSAQSADMVLTLKKGKAHSNLVLKVQDSGGQPVFLQILELLTTPEGTVYVVVFSLSEMLEVEESCIGSTIDQLKSIHLFASKAPVLLVGTCKDDLYTRHGSMGAERVLRQMSKRLVGRLRQRCGPMVENLCWNDELAFFPVENSKDFGGDSTFSALVGAIDKAARALPSMAKKVPLPWLKVLDEMRAAAQSRRCMPFKEVERIGADHGMPLAWKEGTSLSAEIEAMLGYFHSLGAVLQFVAFPTPHVEHGAHTPHLV